MLGYTIAQFFLAYGILLICFLLVVVILLQKGRGGGLATAFGGGGATAFGAKTGDAFTWFTIAFATIFLLLTIVGNYAFDLSAKIKPKQAQQATQTIPTTGTKQVQIPVTPSGETPEGAEATPNPSEEPSSDSAPPAPTGNKTETGSDSSAEKPPVGKPTPPEKPQPHE